MAEKTIEQLEAELIAEKAKNKDLVQINEELQVELKESQATVEQVMIIVTDSKKNKYKFLAKQATIGGKLFTVEDLQKDAKAIDELVKRKSGLITKI